MSHCSRAPRRGPGAPGARRDRALRLDPDLKSDLAAHLAMLSGCAARRRVRHPALPHRSAACPIDGRFAGRARDDPARAAGPAGLQAFYAALPELPLVSISKDQRRPMPPVNWVGACITGCRGSAALHANPDGEVSRLSRPHLPREASRPGDRDRQGRRAQPARSRPKSTPSTRSIGKTDRAAGAAIPMSSTSARSATPKRPRSSATPRRCCSRSTGRSRSAWS